MDRNCGAEIDELRQMVQSLAQRIGGAAAPEEEEGPSGGPVQRMPDTHPDPSIVTALNLLEDTRNREKDSGRIAYRDAFSMGGRQSAWMQNDGSANRLLFRVEDHTSKRARLRW